MDSQISERAKKLREDAEIILNRGGGGGGETARGMILKAEELEREVSKMKATNKFAGPGSAGPSSGPGSGPNQSFKPTNLGIYSNALITRSITIPVIYVGNNINETIEKYVANSFEGKCVVEGFIQPGSVKIVTFSSGIVQSTSIKFEVVFECRICCPVEGMNIECIAKNITKAGIRAESATETPSPIVVFITRDHHYNSPYFLSIQENSKITIRVIGQRFELNDKYISIIAELIEPKKDYGKKKSTAPPRLIIEA
jgi:DNA-directed RNA polymerase subunit E'/Rpb7